MSIKNSIYDTIRITGKTFCEDQQIEFIEKKETHGELYLIEKPFNVSFKISYVYFMFYTFIILKI